MYKKFIPVLIFIFSGVVLAQEKLPVPKESAPYSDKFIKEDKSSGDKIICNQIVVIFNDEATRSEQLSLLQKIKGQIVGGIPEMDIYQIRISNPSVSLSKVKKISSDVQKNEHVAHASPRKVPTGTINKIDFGNKKPVRRMGDLDMEPAARSAPEEEDEMVTTLEMHKKNLHLCLKTAATKHGIIEYRITINPAGKVTDVKVLHSSFSDKKLKECLAYQIRNWDDFPPYTKKYERQLEFSFKF